MNSRVNNTFSRVPLSACNEYDIHWKFLGGYTKHNSCFGYVLVLFVFRENWSPINQDHKIATKCKEQRIILTYVRLSSRQTQLYMIYHVNTVMFFYRKLFPSSWIITLVCCGVFWGCLAAATSPSLASVCVKKCVHKPSQTQSSPQKGKMPCSIQSAIEGLL